MKRVTFVFVLVISLIVMGFAQEKTEGVVTLEKILRKHLVNGNFTQETIVSLLKSDADIRTMLKYPETNEFLHGLASTSQVNKLIINYENAPFAVDKEFKGMYIPLNGDIYSISAYGKYARLQFSMLPTMDDVDDVIDDINKGVVDMSKVKSLEIKSTHSLICKVPYIDEMNELLPLMVKGENISFVGKYIDLEMGDLVLDPCYIIRNPAE